MAAAVTLSVSTEKQDNNLESYSVVWLDRAKPETQEYLNAQKRLRKSINYLNIFDDIDQTDSYIRSVPEVDRIIFIVSDQMSREIVPRIHSLQQVFAIYIYGSKSKEIDDWTTKLSKVKGITMKLDVLVDKILSDQTTRVRGKVDELLSINIFNTTSGREQSTTGLNGQFIHSQLLIDCLISMIPKATDKNQLVDLCEKFYKDNATELAIVREFERDYVADRALWWYTRESFLYRLLNKALRTQDIDCLFLFRFFIRDIHKQLAQLQCPTSIRVYRGQVISNDELQALKDSMGQFISMNSFLSTSLDRRLALSFLLSSTSSTDLQRILFEIDLDPTLVGSKPFANITSNSFFINEQEVLIMLGSIFRLVQIDYQDRVGRSNEIVQ